MKIKFKPSSVFASSLRNSKKLTGFRETKLSPIHNANLICKRNLSFSTSFGIAGLDYRSEFNRVEHTPIFTQVVTGLLLPKSDQALCNSREKVSWFAFRR